MKALILFFFLFITFFGLSQKEWNKNLIDSKLDEAYQLEFTNHDSSMLLTNLIIKKSADLNYELGFANSILHKGYLLEDIGNYTEAILLYDSSIVIFNRLNNSKGIAKATNSLGLLLNYQGNYNKALLNLQIAYDAYQKEENLNGQAMVLGNMGLVQINVRNYDNALEYYNKSLKLKTNLGDSLGIAIDLMNIGNVYSSTNRYDTALVILNNSVNMSRLIDDQVGVSYCYTSIGEVYLKQKQYKLAEESITEAMKIQISISDKNGLASSYRSLGSMYLLIDKTKEAKEALNKGLIIVNELKLTPIKLDLYNSLSKAYAKEGDYRTALDYQILFSNLRDSLNSSDIRKQLTEADAKYHSKLKDQEIEKKSLELNLNEAEISKHKLEGEFQRYIIILGGVVFCLFIVFLLFIFNRLKVTRKQKTVIEKAHGELGEKNKEIMDSINYAKRIQNAILPPNKIVKEYLQESFILYKPKDIVAGDFYWLEHKNDKILFAAADCTGHGVPGAMVSVVCNNGLNRSVREHGLTDPGKILDKTREIVIAEFEKSEDEVKDGMDIALCSLEGSTLLYAGAHNPLWIIRNGEVIETKANKQPIGKFDKQSPYTTHSFDLEKGDTIYIFSDGYVDQFGGEKGKKFKSKPFKQLLLSIQDKAMEEQKVIIDDTFEAWRGSLEQIDDVCVIGVRV